MTDLKPDYKNTVRLPKTDFPLKADLPLREPKIVEFWDKIKVYEQLEAKAAGKEKFILHDGPPFANGHLHTGHALNRTLKDFVLRYQRLLGKYAPFVPGWDCHGLPIEWMIEEKYRKQQKSKDDVSISEFRKECRAFAAHWVGIQKVESQRLGMFGSWENPYLTMDFQSEAIIVQELHKFLMNGGLYLGFKPVQWSVIEKTALAEAEVEYKDKISPSIYVGFPVAEASHALLNGARIVIWTTTPWTLPANRAVAYGPDVEYVILKVQTVDEANPKAFTQPDTTLVVAQPLLQQFCHTAGVLKYDILATIPGHALKGTTCFHPLHAQGYALTVPLLPAAHVTTDQGTGFVHTAPSHGLEDFALGQEHGLEVPRLVQEDGHYVDHLPAFGGLHIFKAHEPIMQALKQDGNLLAAQEISHSYPHSWRSKAPLIYRATEQWFISMDKRSPDQEASLRMKALDAIENAVQWIPATGKNRIRSMIQDRPDWCISRQRAWGVPIAIFVDKKTSQPLKDVAVNQRIVDAMRVHGADIWFDQDPKQFLAPDYDPKDYDVVTDILDVWFESGSTHAFVLEKRPELYSPADLYLEGSDQHRGWFQSSLLESCGTRNKAPYKAVLTHGFIVDAEGRKISKSAGNGVNIDEILTKHGADILRLWVVGSDYVEDLRIGPEILKRQEDIYRRLRNTLRYLLGNLTDTATHVSYDALPDLEKWVLYRLALVDAAARTKITQYDFHGVFTLLYNFCILDLSAFYFDIRKDVLYCEADSSAKHQATLYVLHTLFEHLCRWLSPILPFTAEEAWQHKYPNISIHTQEFLPVPKEWFREDLGQKWDVLKDVRRVVTGALEVERTAGRIGSSLQAYPTVWVADEALYDVIRTADLAELCITSDAKAICMPAPENAFALEEVPGLYVTVELAHGEKCARCWRVLPEVSMEKAHALTCGRCDDALHKTEVA